MTVKIFRFKHNNEHYVVFGSRVVMLRQPKDKLTIVFDSQGLITDIDMTAEQFSDSAEQKQAGKNGFICLTNCDGEKLYFALNRIKYIRTSGKPNIIAHGAPNNLAHETWVVLDGIEYRFLMSPEQVNALFTD